MNPETCGVINLQYYIVLVRGGNPQVSPFLRPLPEKNDLYIRIPAAFPWSEGGKLHGENNLGLKAFGDHSMRCKSAVFWQSERYNVSVSTRTETDGFTGLSGTGPDTV